jgi:hypothetical protein
MNCNGLAKGMQAERVRNYYNVLKIFVSRPLSTRSEENY